MGSLVGRESALTLTSTPVLAATDLTPERPQSAAGATAHTLLAYRAGATLGCMWRLQYTRDQQITTAKGIVMGRLRSLQRQNEVEVMQFCFEKLGLNVVGLVEEPGFLEGGDFYVAGAPAGRTPFCRLTMDPPHAPAVGPCGPPPLLNHTQAPPPVPIRTTIRIRVYYRRHPCAAAIRWRTAQKPPPPASLTHPSSVPSPDTVRATDSQGPSCACWGWACAPTWRRRSS